MSEKAVLVTRETSYVGGIFVPVYFLSVPRVDIR